MDDYPDIRDVATTAWAVVFLAARLQALLNSIGVDDDTNFVEHPGPAIGNWMGFKTKDEGGVEFVRMSMWRYVMSDTLIDGAYNLHIGYGPKSNTLIYNIGGPYKMDGVW